MDISMKAALENEKNENENEQNNVKVASGFEGLLVLLGIGIVLSPIRLVTELYSTYLPIFTDGTWDKITSMNSLSYDPYWGTLVIIELIANVVFLFLAIHLLQLYFKKKAIFVKWYLIVATLSTTFILADAYIVAFVYPTIDFASTDNMTNFASSLIALLLWAPYLYRSQSAKNTFVND